MPSQRCHITAATKSNCNQSTPLSQCVVVERALILTHAGKAAPTAAGAQRLPVLSANGENATELFCAKSGRLAAELQQILHRFRATKAARFCFTLLPPSLPTTLLPTTLPAVLHGSETSAVALHSQLCWQSLVLMAAIGVARLFGNLNDGSAQWCILAVQWCILVVQWCILVVQWRILMVVPSVAECC